MTLVEKLETELKNVEFVLTNEDLISHRIYPCPCSNECGTVVYEIYHDKSRVFSLGLYNDERLDIARRVLNETIFKEDPPMSKRNFVDFLIALRDVHLQEQKVREN
jgi:hypothetical protein